MTNQDVDLDLVDQSPIIGQTLIEPTAHRFENSPVPLFRERQPIQAKLKIGQPNDRYEQEADRMADLVVRQLSTGQIQSKRKEKKRPQIQRKCQACSGQNYASNEITNKLRQKKGQGKPLLPQIQTKMEKGFGVDFSQVRVHTDGEAVQLNQQLGARAFTYGADVFFNRGEYEPSSLKGQQLLAHELTHVVQQDRNSVPLIQRWVAPTDWLDYIGLGIDLGERLYIELTYEDGEEKDFQRFVNTLFFAIDLILASLPGAGGGGLAIRASHSGAVLAWQAIPDSAKLSVAEQVAKSMGWSLAKAVQMTNRYFESSKGKGGSPSTQRNKNVNDKNPKGPSGRESRKKYLKKRWDKATFGTVEKSIEFHVKKHGKGLSEIEYTQIAEKAFKSSNSVKSSIGDNLGRKAVKVVSEFGAGLFTPAGKIIWFHPKL